MAAAKGVASPSNASTVMADGVVQNVDAGKGVVTLKHGEIANVRMPAMTMGYSVADKKILARVKAGDKVKFHVEMLQNVLFPDQGKKEGPP